MSLTSPTKSFPKSTIFTRATSTSQSVKRLIRAANNITDFKRMYYLVYPITSFNYNKLIESLYLRSHLLIFKVRSNPK